jgi:hypothetical protein
MSMLRNQGQPDRDRREVRRAAGDRGARLLGVHGVRAWDLGLGDRQAQYKEKS